MWVNILCYWIYYATVGNDHNRPQAPVIKNHPPQGVQIPQGHKVTLEVMAYGTEPLYYQWHYKDEIMPGMYLCIIDIHACNLYLCFTGQDKSYCEIFPATSRNTGCYYCQVKNQYGVVSSSTTTLIVTTLSSTASGLCYTPLITENFASDKRPVMLQTKDLES